MPQLMHVFPQIPSIKAATYRQVRQIRVMALLAVLVGAWPAQAVKADRDEPLSFAADAARVDEGQKLNVLTGNVEITKGTMVVKAERVEVRQNPDGTQSAAAFGAQGGKAYFSQKRDGVDETIQGEAERVDYDGRTDTVRFTGSSIMRRYRGAKVSDEVAGQTIVYDNKTSVFQVLGAATGSAGSSGRVRGVITPRSADVTPSAPTTATKTTPKVLTDGGRP